MHEHPAVQAGDARGAVDGHCRDDRKRQALACSATSGSVRSVARGDALKRKHHVNWLGYRSRVNKPTTTNHICGHPLPRVCPKGRLNGAYRLTVYVCHAFCSKVQATSTDLLFGAGGAPGRLRYDRVSTWCSLAGLGLGLLGSRAPGTTYNVSRAALIEALQRLASDEGEEPEARQHGYGQLDTRPQHPDRSWSSRRLSGGSGTSKSLT